MWVQTKQLVYTQCGLRDVGTEKTLSCVYSYLWVTEVGCLRGKVDHRLVMHMTFDLNPMLMLIDRDANVQGCHFMSYATIMQTQWGMTARETTEERTVVRCTIATRGERAYHTSALGVVLCWTHVRMQSRSRSWSERSCLQLATIQINTVLFIA